MGLLLSVAAGCGSETKFSALSKDAQPSDQFVSNSDPQWMSTSPGSTNTMTSTSTGTGVSVTPVDPSGTGTTTTTSTGTSVAQNPPLSPACVDLRSVASNADALGLLQNVSIETIYACNIIVQIVPKFDVVASYQTESQVHSSIGGSFENTWCFVRFMNNDSVLPAGSIYGIKPTQYFEFQSSNANLDQRELRMYLTPPQAMANGGYSSTQMSCYHHGRSDAFSLGELMQPNDKYFNISLVVLN